MNNIEATIVFANYLSAFVGLLLMQTKYRGYTLVERLSLAFLIGALAVNASMHVLDGRSQGACAEGLLSIAILCRFLTAALWRFLKCGKCPVTILAGVAAITLCGCGNYYQQWDRTHERTYGVTYDADSKSGAVSMTIRPAGVASSAPAPAAGMNDETIAKIVKIIYEASAKQQTAAILETPALK